MPEPMRLAALVDGLDGPFPKSNGGEKMKAKGIDTPRQAMDTFLSKHQLQQLDEDIRTITDDPRTMDAMKVIFIMGWMAAERTMEAKMAEAVLDLLGGDIAATTPPSGSFVL